MMLLGQIIEEYKRERGEVAPLKRKSKQAIDLDLGSISRVSFGHLWERGSGAQPEDVMALLVNLNTLCPAVVHYLMFLGFYL